MVMMPCARARMASTVYCGGPRTTGTGEVTRCPDGRRRLRIRDCDLVQGLRRCRHRNRCPTGARDRSGDIGRAMAG
jgi:hypothetical protein